MFSTSIRIIYIYIHLCVHVYAKKRNFIMYHTLSVNFNHFSRKYVCIISFSLTVHIVKKNYLHKRPFIFPFLLLFFFLILLLTTTTSCNPLSILCVVWKSVNLISLINQKYLRERERGKIKQVPKIPIVMVKRHHDTYNNRKLFTHLMTGNGLSAHNYCEFYWSRRR